MWSQPQVGLSHAFNEADPKFYGVPVALCGDFYIRLLRSYKLPGDQIIDIRLTASRDGINWFYPNGFDTFIELGPDGTLDSGMVFATAPLSEDDLTYIYYDGLNGPHSSSKRRSGIELATLAKDLFSGVGAAHQGYVEVGPITDDAKSIRVNVDVQSGGFVRAALGRTTGEAMPGFSAREDYIPIYESG